MFYLLKRLRNKVIPVLYFFRETDVVFKFVPEMPYRSSNRPCGSITKRANRVSFYFSLDVPKKIDVFFAAKASFDPVQYFFKPTCSFTARRTLSAALVVVEA
jgi:hypothetical protein